MRYAQYELNLDLLKTSVFLNIFWSVLRQGDLKYQQFKKKQEWDEETLEKERSLAVRKGKKDKDNDFALFKSLLEQHSIDNPD